MHKYTEEQGRFIRENIAGTDTNTLTNMLNDKFELNLDRKSIRAYIKNHKLKSGLDTTFKSGSVPYNKGVKGICAKGCEKGWFKKGSNPHNHKPVGSERIDVQGYTLVKIKEPNVWRMKHRLLWEKLKGPIPKGHVLIFADRNKQNFNIDNLILISRNQLKVMNGKDLIKYNADLTKIGVMIADINLKINERKNNI